MSRSAGMVLVVLVGLGALVALAVVGRVDEPRAAAGRAPDPPAVRVTLGPALAKAGTVAEIAAATTETAGTPGRLVRGHALVDHQPVAGMTLTFEAATGERRTVTTGDRGAFEVELAPVPWSIRTDLPDTDLLAIELRSCKPDEVEAELALTADEVTERHGKVMARLAPGPWPAEPISWSGADVIAPGAVATVRFLSPFALEGQVVDWETGAALDAATAAVAFALVADPSMASATDYRTIAAVTGSDGRFALRLPRSRGVHEASVLVEREDYAPAGGSLPFDVLCGRTRLRVPLRRPVTLEGLVRDPSGRPVAATITVSTSLPDVVGEQRVRRERKWTVHCGADGRFMVDQLTPGAAFHRPAQPRLARLDVEVHHPGHARVKLWDVLAGPSLPPLEVVLPRFVSQRGRVLGPDGRPAGGLLVRTLVTPKSNHDRHEGPTVLDHDDAVTDGEGRFVLEEVPERCLLGVFGPDPYARSPRDVFELSLPVPDLVLRLEPPAAPISGRLVHLDGSPAPHGKVKAFLAEAPAAPPDQGAVLRAVQGAVEIVETDATGAFRLASLPRGATFDLAVADVAGEPPFAVRRTPIARGVPAGTSDLVLVVDVPVARVHVVVEAPGLWRSDIAVRHGLVGEVVRSPLWKGPPVARFGPPRKAPPRDPLSRAIAITRFGAIFVLVRAPGHVPAVRRVQVAAGDELRLEPIQLLRGGGALALRVRWPDGPAPNLIARLHEPVTGIELEESLEPPRTPDGLMLVGWLGAGDVRLRLATRWHGGPERPLTELAATVREGETTIVDVDLTGGGR